MGMLFNIVEMISIIALLICILFIIYKLVRQGKSAVNLNHFLCIIVCMLIFAVSMEARTFYLESNSLKNNIIFTNKLVMDTSFDENKEIEKLISETNLEKDTIKEMVDILKKCGFEEFYFNGICEKGNEDNTTIVYTFKYKDKIIGVNASSAMVWNVYSGECCFYKNGKIMHHRSEWYLSEDEKNEIQTKAVDALKKYAKKSSFDVDNWQILKMWKMEKGYLVTSIEDEIYIYFLPNRELYTLIIENKLYYPQAKINLK